MDRVGDPKTELDLHPNSPGYRLILNNIVSGCEEEKEENLGKGIFMLKTFQKII